MMRPTATSQQATKNVFDCEELCRTQHPRVFKLCRLLLVDYHEAQEVAQEVFLKFVRVWQTGEQIRSWEAWLTRVAVNACRDRQRSAWWKWRRKGYLEVQTIELSDQQLNPEEHILSREQQEKVWRCFRSLSSRQREVFVLRRLEGHSNEETADLLGLSSGSIKRHLFHALRHLQKALGDQV